MNKLGAVTSDTKKTSGAIRSEEKLFVEITYSTKEGLKRAHTQKVGRNIETHNFTVGERLELPFSTAVKYCMDGFRVTDKAGDTYQNKAGVVEEGHSAAQIKLKPGEVVAHLRELTGEALAVRCNQTPGGEKLRRNVEKDKLINFLVSSSMKGAAPKKDDDDGDLMEMSAAELEAEKMEME